MHEKKFLWRHFVWILNSVAWRFDYKLILTTSDMTTFCILAYLPWPSSAI